MTKVSIKDLEGQYSIQKNNQNSLKGLLWGTGGASLTVGALGLTAFTVASVAATTLASMGILINDFARNSIGAGVPVMVALTAAAVLVDYIAIKFTGYCFSNSIYHLGPECQVVKH